MGQRCNMLKQQTRSEWSKDSRLMSVEKSECDVREESVTADTECSKVFVNVSSDGNDSGSSCGHSSCSIGSSNYGTDGSCGILNDSSGDDW
ncbi:Hypothetical predicted protein [Octopus vulgaris]|uniref:Uncharacterized protein n=1 Tax=Octopus vulgaris TaxID=6645 RepID=A0AA36F4W8_OCTVU|nr:Hypothetical predicted protein [Octopus vulgaris]